MSKPPLTHHHRGVEDMDAFFFKPVDKDLAQPAVETGAERQKDYVRENVVRLLETMATRFNSNPASISGSETEVYNIRYAIRLAEAFLAELNDKLSNVSTLPDEKKRKLTLFAKGIMEEAKFIPPKEETEAA